MSDFVVVVPTRGRPLSARRFADACRDTEAWPVFVVDDNDPEIDGYRDILTPDEGLLVAPTGRPGIVDPLNWAVSLIIEKNGPRYIGFAGDDHLPQGDWDVRIIETLSRLGTGICYGDDGLQGELLPTAAFMTSDIPKTLGYMAPPPLNHLFVDNWYLELGRGIGRIEYLPDVKITHLHPLAGLSEWDETYEWCNGNAAPKDNTIWQMYRQRGLVSDIAKIRAIL